MIVTVDTDEIKNKCYDAIKNVTSQPYKNLCYNIIDGFVWFLERLGENYKE